MRIAFIGNSHLAAFIEARDAIDAICGNAEIDFFGLPNQVFFGSPHLDGAALRLEQPVGQARDQLISENGAHVLDLGRYDLVLLTAHAFYFPYFVNDFRDLDVLGHAQTGDGYALISLACAQDIIRSRIRAYAVRLRQFFPQSPNIVVVQAPYPSTEAVCHSPELARLSDHPALGTLFEAYQSTLAAVSRNQGINLLCPPQDTLAKPFFTKPEFARQRTLPDPTAASIGDYLHMNARYAERFFAYFHAEFLS